MSAFDLIVRGGDVVTADGTHAGDDVGVVDGAIVAIGPQLEGGGREEVDAAGRLVLPGAVDAHVHLNDPGRAEWEGFATGTAALAVGGTTCAVDMPQNATPPTVDGAALALKVAAARGAARVDVALWGGLVPGNLEQLDELAAGGVVGFKAFMADSGIDDFPASDDETLHAGMARAAALGLPVAVHAEDQALIAQRTAAAREAGRAMMRDYLDSRPIEAECSAIARAIALARETGCALHVVHVSSADGVDLVAQARAEGVDVTCETCPHYLLLDEADALRLGAIAKCAPPLRSAAERAALVEVLEAHEVDWLATDHSPSPASMKEGDDIFAVWGGIAGAQTLLTAALDLEFSPPVVARLVASAPAARLGLSGAKGELCVGADADLVIADPGVRWTLHRDDLRDRHRLSPFAGHVFQGQPQRTILRGVTIALDGEPIGDPTGRVLRRGTG
jgi:allantoinase